MDRNLLVGFAVSLTLAALLAVLVQNVPIHLFRPSPPPPPVRAGAVWAESRDLSWQPRIAVPPAAPAAVPEASPPPRAGKPKQTSAPAVVIAAAPGGGVAVAVAPPASAAPSGVGEPGAPPPSPAAGAGPTGAAPADAAQVYGPGDVDVPPAPIAAPQPPFPPAAQQLGLAAEVVLALVIEADGRVSHVDARCSGCDASFLRSTRETARTWRFTPARLRGEAVRVRVEQRIHFDLDD